MIEKNIKNNEEIIVEDLLKALTFDGEREVKSTHKFPPFLFTAFHVYRMEDETKVKVLEEVRKIRELHQDDEELQGRLTLSCYLYHLTDLPRELVTGDVLAGVLAKPNRQFANLIASVVEEITESMGMSVIQLETLNVIEKAKKLV